MMAGPLISVVVATIDRADSLELLLRALELQEYEPFEVVVVAGPGTDHTDDVLHRWESRVCTRRTSVKNLSVARNVGIRASAGDFIAFIDDDAYPEPSWLTDLATAIVTDPEVGAVGGLVLDHTGARPQYVAMGCSRLGRPQHLDHANDGAWGSVPGSWSIPYAPGGNALYRRQALAVVGGFDEFYEYYLDEVDVCVRLADSGYRVVQLERGAIHHKNRPSDVRTEQRVVRDWYSVLKNKTYFSFKHSDLTRDELLADAVLYAEFCAADLQRSLDAGLLDAVEVDGARGRFEHAIEDGVAAGLQVREGAAPTVSVERERSDAVPFLEGPRFDPTKFIFVGSGEASLPSGLASLAERGHQVRRLVHDAVAENVTVDLRDGVWEHRVPMQAAASPGDITATLTELNRTSGLTDGLWCVVDGADHLAPMIAASTTLPLLTLISPASDRGESTDHRSVAQLIRLSTAVAPIGVTAEDLSQLYHGLERFLVGRSGLARFAGLAEDDADGGVRPLTSGLLHVARSGSTLVVETFTPGWLEMRVGESRTSIEFSESGVRRIALPATSVDLRSVGSMVLRAVESWRAPTQVGRVTTGADARPTRTSTTSPVPAGTRILPAGPHTSI